MMLQCRWLRVILDEAHCIRNTRTLASKVCCQLKAEYRWCVSGTILQNSSDDIYGIMKFLDHEPWCISSFWNTAITLAGFNGKTNPLRSNPGLENQEKSLGVAIDRIRRLLSPIMIRRTKDSLTKDGVPILTLPPVESKTIVVILSEPEREFYNAVLARSLAVFDGFIRDGTAAKAYFQIFSLLSRLRQTCDHIALTVKSKVDDEEWMTSQNKIDDPDVALHTTLQPTVRSANDISKQFLGSLLKKFYRQQESNDKNSKENQSDNSDPSPKRVKTQAYVAEIASTISQSIQANAKYADEECPICLDRPQMTAAVLTPCGHIFCRNCLADTFRSRSPTMEAHKTASENPENPQGMCPTCQETFYSKDILDIADAYGNHIESPFDNMKAHIQRDNEKNLNFSEDEFVVARQVLKNAVSGTESSKMKAIMNELKEIWKLDPGSKVLMFSHYLGFLDLLGTQFNEMGVPYFRLDGSLNVKERMKVLDDFRGSPAPKTFAGDVFQKGTVLLMSMSQYCCGVVVLHSGTVVSVYISR
jgi:DNA repair protein RAD5